MTEPIVPRTIEQALANVERMRRELPILIQPSASDCDLLVLGDHITNLARRLEEAIQTGARIASEHACLMVENDALKARLEEAEKELAKPAWQRQFSGEPTPGNCEICNCDQDQAPCCEHVCPGCAELMRGLEYTVDALRETAKENSRIRVEDHATINALDATLKDAEALIRVQQAALSAEDMTAHYKDGAEAALRWAWGNWQSFHGGLAHWDNMDDFRERKIAAGLRALEEK